VAEPVQLVDVNAVRPAAERVIDRFRQVHRDLLAGVELHHIGATSLPFGHTKGDVDVNLRVPHTRFPSLVDALRTRLRVAQPKNWTETFASFSAPGYELPLGIQVTAVGSDDDFLLALRDRLDADHEALRRYEALKLSAAGAGPEEYWRSKNAFFE